MFWKHPFAGFSSSLHELKAQLEKDKSDALAWFTAQDGEQ